MTQPGRAKLSAVGGYGAQGGAVTLALVVLTVAAFLAVNVGWTVVAGGLYALALAVTSPLLAAEAGAFRTWLFD